MTFGQSHKEPRMTFGQEPRTQEPRMTFGQDQRGGRSSRMEPGQLSTQSPRPRETGSS